MRTVALVLLEVALWAAAAGAVSFALLWLMI